MDSLVPLWPRTFPDTQFLQTLSSCQVLCDPCRPVDPSVFSLSRAGQIKVTNKSNFLKTVCCGQMENHPLLHNCNFCIRTYSRLKVDFQTTVKMLKCQYQGLSIFVSDLRVWIGLLMWCRLQMGDIHNRTIICYFAHSGEEIQYFCSEQLFISCLRYTHNTKSKICFFFVLNTLRNNSLMSVVLFITKSYYKLDESLLTLPPSSSPSTPGFFDSCRNIFCV